MEVIHSSIIRATRGAKNKPINEKTIINNHHHYNGFFSNFFNIDLSLMKNKVVLVTIIISMIIYFGITLLKFFPINMQYNHVFMSAQLLLLAISLSVIMFAVFSYSILTYLVSFIAYSGIIATTDRFINYTVMTISYSNNLKRFMIYTLALVLTFITFYTLKKFKVNISVPDKKKENIA